MSAHQQIIAAYRRGVSLLTIADRFGVTCADVQRIMVRVGGLERAMVELPIERMEHPNADPSFREAV